MTERAKVAAIILLAGLSACRTRDFFTLADYRLPFDERLRLELAAPIIILGRVLQVTDVGRPQKSYGDPRILVQLTRMRVDVEEIVKGRVDANPTDFYVFTYSLQNTIDLGVPRYIPNIGQHRIYFLKYLNGVYRNVGDVTNYNLRVTSGQHPKGFCAGKAPGRCIAELLLTPAKGLDASEFADDLYTSEYVASAFSSSVIAHNLVQQLANHPDSRVADAAAELLAGEARGVVSLPSPY
ncbi:MAG TPA: hypothetical protein VNX18_08560 [Bryobacteraceae bacterium]|jgi:hypothetical protein|nr:hypothetical protein [Bryobacteraceae bacterium]